MFYSQTSQLFLDFNIPLRPSWDYNFTKEELLIQENNYFNDYVSKLRNGHYGNKLSHFEHNLEVIKVKNKIILDMETIMESIRKIRYYNNSSRFTFSSII